MPPRLFTAALDEPALRQVLRTFNTELTTIYLESETRTVLTSLVDYLGPKITLPPVRWLTGRAFGPALEIRWRLSRQVEDPFDVISLSENDTAPTGPPWQASPWNARFDQTTRPRQILLLGVNSMALPPDHVHYNTQPDGGLWIDTQIPRPLNYPMSDPTAKRVMLRCLDYLARGVVVLTRFCELVAYGE